MSKTLYKYRFRVGDLVKFKLGYYNTSILKGFIYKRGYNHGYWIQSSKNWEKYAIKENNVIGLDIVEMMKKEKKSALAKKK